MSSFFRHIIPSHLGTQGVKPINSVRTNMKEARQISWSLNFKRLELNRTEMTRNPTFGTITSSFLFTVPAFPYLNIKFIYGKQKKVNNYGRVVVLSYLSFFFFIYCLSQKLNLTLDSTLIIELLNHSEQKKKKNLMPSIIKWKMFNNEYS